MYVENATTEGDSYYEWNNNMKSFVVYRTKWKWNENVFINKDTAVVQQWK